MSEQLKKEATPVSQPALDIAALAKAIADLREPVVDPVKKAQKEAHRLRERAKEMARVESEQAKADNCEHVHISTSGAKSEALNICYDMPGGAWGHCPKCLHFVKAGHYEIDYDPTDPAGKHRWVPEHKDYQRVRNIIDAKMAAYRF